MPETSLESRPYYGRVMVPVALLVTLASLPGQTVVVGMFNTPMRESLGLSVTQISAAYTAGTFLAAVPLTLIGKVADRLGVRVTTGLIAGAFAVVLGLAGHARGIVTLGIAFFAMRLLGQGSLSMLGGHILALWYERRLGFLESVRHTAMSFGSAVAPLTIAPLIAGLGWRRALVVMGAGVAITVLPVCMTVFRNRPEDLGQHLDGDPTEHETHDMLHGGEPPAGDPAFTLKEAMSTPAYWTLLPLIVFMGTIGTALLFHMQPLLESIGVPKDEIEITAAKAIFPWPITTAIANLSGGWLADRVAARKLLPIAGGLLVVACGIFWAAAVVESLGRFEVIAAGMGVFGLAMGLSTAAANPAFARYFGRTHHGAIRGSVTTAIVAGTGLGPILAGWLFELSGPEGERTFAWVLLGFGAAALPMAIVSATLTPPKPRQG